MTHSLPLKESHKHKLTNLYLHFQLAASQTENCLPQRKAAAYHCHISRSPAVSRS